jgi:NAD(P)-dependent dehydrogenase (short-subunit alcohol dehydrogenase family)
MNILITGASRGLGRRMALAFGRAGHSVAVNYRVRQAEAESVVGEIRALGGKAEGFQADVSDPREAQALVDGVVQRWGPLEGLINNAGVTRDRTLLKMSLDEWREVIDTNLSGPFYCLQAASRQMIRQQRGFILNVGSIVGMRGGVGCANYAAAKAGLMGLTKAAARELGRYHIRVNGILPGFHLTEMGDQIPMAQREKVVAEHALGRTTAVEDLERLVLSLSEMPTVSGQIFNVDSRVL